MSIEKHIDNLIKAAMDRGEFDDLAGKGRPIDLDAYFATPEDVRMGHSILKANNFVPEEVERLNEISELKRLLAASTDEAETARLRKSISEKMLALSLILERSRRRTP